MTLLLIGNTWFYIIVFVVLGHILGGFGFLIYKIYKKNPSSEKETPMEDHRG